MTDNVVPKLPCRMKGVLTCFVQREDFDRAEVQVRQYGRHLYATGRRVFVILLFTPTDPAEHLYFLNKRSCTDAFCILASEFTLEQVTKAQRE